MSSSQTKEKRVPFASLSGEDKQLALIAIREVDSLVKDMKKTVNMTSVFERDLRIQLVKFMFKRLKKEKENRAGNQ